ncbi:MAG: DUF4419 domain-containing protein [Dehalococcoidia bacterium]|jgi:hypothetical protein
MKKFDDTISEKEIILDPALENKELNLTATQFNPRYFFNIEKGFQQVTAFESLISHRNYLDYLTLCWRCHYGVIISPTILWNVVLNNLAYEVNKKPETYRKYFTESKEKIEITILQGGEFISPELLISALQGRVPSKLIEDAFPDFTTDTEESKFADRTAFLDMVSPYYNYSMYLCGIPKVMITGTKSDWLTFMFQVGKITGAVKEFADYLLIVANRIADINDETCNYKDFFSLERCGSGSQVEVSGWIRDFFIEQPKVSYPENFIPCISKIDYHNYNNNSDYRLYAGLFSSTVEGGYLVPTFKSVYFKKIDKAEVKEQDANTITIETETKIVKGGVIRINDIDQSIIEPE